MTEYKVTPSQTVGPFFHFALPYKDGEKVARDDMPGRHIVVEGRVLDGAGKPIPDALIEIWQANAEGRYDHPDDTREEIPLTRGFNGFGRCMTDPDGRYHFVTVKPGPVPGPGNTLQAPHLAVNVFARGMLDRLVTRIYFADETLNENDPVLGLIAEAERRATLLAQPEGNGERTHYVRDIVLQGENETVFFRI